MLYFILFMFSVVFTYCIKEVAIKKSFLDIPNSRSNHTIPTPHGGGVAIAISWFMGLSYLYSIKMIESSLYFALMSGVIIAVISFIDDFVKLKVRIRLIVQGVGATIGLNFLDGLTKIDLGIVSFDNPILTNIFAFFMIVWFINLYNFLDGIDGYAGSEALFLAIAGFVLFGGSHFLVLIFSVLGFLVWNWYKAKIFMGDVGSTLLGYTVAIFVIYYQNSGTSILVWMILFGAFWFDATLTLFRRYRNGEEWIQPHNKHGYQRLVQSGLSHSRVVFYSIGVNISLFILAYFFKSATTLQFPIFIISTIFLYLIMMLIDKKKKFL